MESRVKKQVFLLYLLDSHSLQFISDGKTFDSSQEASRALSSFGLSKNTRRAKELVDAGEAWIRTIALAVSDKDSVKLDAAEKGKWKEVIA